jgi:hypothetical protein
MAEVAVGELERVLEARLAVVLHGGSAPGG